MDTKCPYPGRLSDSLIHITIVSTCTCKSCRNPFPAFGGSARSLIEGTPESVQTKGDSVKETWMGKQTGQPKRAAERHKVALGGRLTWKDERGATRFVSVVTQDVSELGAFVECRTPVSIPLFRLVQFQLERESADCTLVPAALRQGRVLSAVYRVRPATRSGEPLGLALRLLVDPRRLAATTPHDKAAATA